MRRPKGIICAGGLLLLTLGCMPHQVRRDSVKADAQAKSKDSQTTAHVYYVPGAMETVSVSTKNALRKMGLLVQATPEGESLRLSTASKSGQRFSLLLTRAMTVSGERTEVRVDWQNNPELDLWADLLRLILAPELE
jgi:hypothetical protein